MKLSHHLIVVSLCTASLALGCSGGAILDNGAQIIPPAQNLPQGTASTYKGYDLGGIMIWDLAGDVHDATQPNSIVNKVSSRLNN